MSIVLHTHINTTPERIANKEHNIYIGISIANAYFSKKNTQEYFNWALHHSKQKPIILIADELQAYNYQAFYGLSRNEALGKARKIGEEIHRMAAKIVNQVQETSEEYVSIVHISDVLTDEHRRQFEVLEKEFQDNKTFRAYLLDVISSNLRSKNLSSEQQLCASKYILTEIPLLNNFVFNNTHYDLFPYPGKNTGVFMNNLAQRRIFPNVADRLNLSTTNASVEAYVQNTKISLEE